jgi:hypothetical protein
LENIEVAFKNPEKQSREQQEDSNDHIPNQGAQERSNFF